MIDAAERDRRAERSRRPIEERHMRLLRRGDSRDRIELQLRRHVPETHLEAAPAVVAPAQAQVQGALGEVLRLLVVVELGFLCVDLDESIRVLGIGRARGGQQRLVSGNRVEERFVERQGERQRPFDELGIVVRRECRAALGERVGHALYRGGLDGPAAGREDRGSENHRPGDDTQGWAEHGFYVAEMKGQST